MLGPQWGAAVGLVPWFALAGACHVGSQLSQSLAEARAELNRSVAVQVGYLVVLAALILLALQFASRGVWLVSAAVGVAELLRYLGYLVLARAVLDLRAAQVFQAHVPAIFAGVGVALAIAAARWVLTGAPALAVLAAEIVVGALALVLCIRVCPAPAVRAELWFRLESAGLLGPPDGRRRRVASLVVGPPDRAVREVRRFLTIVLLGIGAVIVAAFGIALLDVTIRRAEVGAALVFLSAVIQAVFIYEVPSVRLGGAGVGVTDLVAVIVLAAATARCLRLRDFSRHLHWLILLGTLLLVSLIFGIAGHGVQASVGDARQYFFFVGAALYMATFRPTLELYERIGRVWLIMAGLMVLLACARWLQVFAGVDLRVPAERYGVDTATRVLDGPYAFFLAGALLLTVPFWFRHGQARWVRWMGALLLVVVVVLDRRTVWLALLVGVAVLLLRGRRLGGRAITLVVVASVITVLAFAGDVLARDQAPAGKMVTSTGTLDWRIAGWSELVTGLVNRARRTGSWGMPFGSGFTRVVEGSNVTAHPHNFIIETMVRAGVGGLIALIALSFGLLRRLWRVRVGGVGLFDPGMLAPLLAMQVVWCLTWVPGLEQGIVTGMAIAVAAVLGRAAAVRRMPRPTGPPQPLRKDRVRGAAPAEAPRPHPAPRGTAATSTNVA